MITPDPDDFAESLQALAHVLGVEAVRKLVQTYGARRIYVPGTWNEPLLLNHAIGQSAAQLMVKHFGKSFFDIPRSPFSNRGRLRLLNQMREQGHTNNEIAEVLGLTRRSVSRVSQRGSAVPARRRAPLTDARQIDLVDMLANLKKSS